MKHSFTAAILSTIVTGCLNAPIANKNMGTASQEDTPGVRRATVKSDADGILTAELSQLSGEIQTIQASEDSEISGTTVSFPPGAIAVATDITMQLGADISGSVAAESGLTNVEATSSPVYISSSVPFDALQPFTLAIALPQGSGLTEGGDKYYTILYVVDVVASGQKVSGLIPTSKITIKDGKAYFDTKNFGVFQVAQVTTPVLEEKKTETKIEVRPATETGPDLVVNSVDPLVSKTGDIVTIAGKNFRKSLTLALAGRAVSADVKSDVSASFILPAGTGTGFRDLDIKQDAISHRAKLFARADGTGLPLITMTPTGVCAGISYIDGNGNQQTGTKACEGNMNIGVYDTNKDGIVDNAAYALSSGSANIATYAHGKAGSSIAAASSLTMQEDGTFFDVTGSNVSISSFSNRPVGTRVTLRFNGTNQIIHSDAASGLQLRGDRPTSTLSGDTFDFVSIGSSRWAELGRYQVLSLSSASMGASPQNGLGAYSTTPIIPTEETLDRRGEFDPTTGLFTASATGYYNIEGAIKVEHANYTSNCSGGSLYLYVKRTGASNIATFSQHTPCVAGVRTASGRLLNYLLNAGDSVYLSAYVGVSDTTGTAKNFSTKPMFRVMRVVD